MKNMLDIKNVWPDWEITEQIGRGSYGVVYKAVRKYRGLESVSAIKVISVPLDESELDELKYEGMNENDTKKYLQQVVDEIIGEIQLMESLKGIQNIVSVEDYKVVESEDSIKWDIYLRMELLTPLNKYLCDKKMGEKLAIKLGIDICNALIFCEKRNIIHRDIKPENIFVNDFGDFKLGDFGIARKLENMTFGMSQKGTFNYMAPEAATGSFYDASVDLYSLGIVLYRMMNENRMPFLNPEKQILSPEDRRSAFERRMSGEEFSAPVNASDKFAKVILKACAFKPADRFTSASQMKKALLALWNESEGAGESFGTVGVANADSLSESKKTKKERTRRLAWWAIALICAGSLVSIAFLTNSIYRAIVTGKVTENIALSSYESESDSAHGLTEIEKDVRIYKEAVNLMEQGVYDEAHSLFSLLDDYLDSDDLETECLYRLGESMIKEKNISVAGEAFAELAMRDNLDSVLGIPAYAEDYRIDLKIAPDEFYNPVMARQYWGDDGIIIAFLYDSEDTSGLCSYILYRNVLSEDHVEFYSFDSTGKFVVKESF